MKDLNALARPEANKRPPRRRASAGEKGKSPPCFWEREDVTPGATQRQVKDLLAVERVQARKRKVLRVSGSEKM